MPQWGRPPGARGSKQRKRWERERERALWEERQNIRIEELDSDDSDTHGVELNTGERFSSDSLHFTGVDMSSTAVTGGLSAGRRGYHFDDSDLDSEGSRSSEDDGNQSARQIALREKEEALVQAALARIRRAREKGKSEVKLSAEELAALERRRKRMQSKATSSKARKGNGSERSRRHDRDMVTIPIIQPEPRRHSDRRREQSPPRTSSGGPGMLVEGPGGVLSYAPIGHYPPGSSNRNSPTRPRSSTSLSQSSRRGTPPPNYVEPYHSGRHFSEEIRPASSINSPRLPLPHEEGWTPSSRRSSVSSQNFTPDPFEYQTSSGPPPPIPSQYMQQEPRRRNVSGPPQVSYSSVRRSPPVTTTSSTSRMRQSMSASDPYLDRRRDDELADSQGSSRSSDDDYSGSDDFGNGVSVAERPVERPAAQVSRKPVGGGGGGGKKKSRR
jgi:PRA1 family protein 1